MARIAAQVAPSCAMVVFLLVGAAPDALFADETADPVFETGTNVDSYSDAADPQLRSLISILLAENPEIRSARTGTRSMLQRVPQARSLPDPRLSYRYFAMTPETRVGPQEHGLELSQSVPWKGKLGLQAERAELSARSSAWRVRDLERILVAELKGAYFGASYLQEALIINEEERELLRRFESIALRRYATGQGIQQSVVKVQTDISRLDDQDTELRERLDVVVRRIAELIGRPDSELSLQTIAIDLTKVDYDPSKLEQQSVVRHPKVYAIKERISADIAWSKRRELEYRPDFRFGIGYTLVDDREDRAGVLNPPENNGQDVLSLLVGINIPIYHQRIEAGLAEAQESRQSNEELLATTQNRLRYLVQESLLKLESLEERSLLYSEVLIPQAEESLASAEAAYTTGKQDFLDLLDAERVLFQVRLTYYRLLSDYWIALSDLEFAIAEPFPRMAGDAAQEHDAVAAPEVTQ